MRWREKDAKRGRVKLMGERRTNVAEGILEEDAEAERGPEGLRDDHLEGGE